MIHLLKYFKTLSLRPENAKEIRAIILELAIRGRLTEEWRRDNPEVEPASVLLERIREKNKVKKSKYAIDDIGKTPQIPGSWAWLPLGDVCNLKSGNSYPKSRILAEGDYMYVKVSSMNISGNEIEILDSQFYINQPTFKSRDLIPSGSIIFPKRGGAIATNKKRLVNNEILVDPNIMSITPIDKSLLQYISLWFSSIDLWLLNTGTSVPQVNNKDIGPIPFPLPPLPEQHAIVTTVNRLLAEVDELEQQTTRFQALRQDYVTASLRALTGEDSGGAWAALRPHFQSFFNQENGVKKLREAILELAIRGRLTEEWRRDNPEVEPASVLLERIRKERNSKRPTYGIEEDSGIFEIPSNWKWFTLNEVCELKSGNSYPKPKILEDGDWMYIKVSGMNIPGNETEIISSQFYLNSPSFNPRDLIPSGSIIFPKRGGAIATNKKRLVGKSVLVDPNIMAITPVDISLLQYVNLWFSSIDLWILNTGTSVPQVNNKDIGPLLIPLPPLPEQKAIVKIVDKLMALCDRLEGQIEEREAVGGNFLRASVGELLAATENVTT